MVLARGPPGEAKAVDGYVGWTSPRCGRLTSHKSCSSSTQTQSADDRGTLTQHGLQSAQAVGHGDSNSDDGTAGRCLHFYRSFSFLRPSSASHKAFDCQEHWCRRLSCHSLHGEIESPTTRLLETPTALTPLLLLCFFFVVWVADYARLPRSPTWHSW